MQLQKQTTRIWFISLFLTFLFLPNFALTQNQWNWGWNKDDESINFFNYFEEKIKHQSNNMFYKKFIEYYKKNVSPKQGPRCPCFPSCSTFTLYSMGKYGFIWGLIMGIERIYFRENLDITYRIHYLTIEINGKEKVYDPPEANFIFNSKDWRLINPSYFNIFFK